MRLLERITADEFSLTKVLLGNDVPDYAILSHTWGAKDEEPTFEDLKKGTGKNKLGYEKIRFCGDQAHKDGYKYFWVDTCCIEKSNSTELQEAINSMFQWYRNSAKCYVYLADISAHEVAREPAFRRSRWFTRGWTLQELIAPTCVEFFSKEGEWLGDKKSLEQQIHKITEIPVSALQGCPLSHFTIPERMCWAGKRETTRKEDKAYCLFGIFDIHMPLIYGEGEKEAFIRLREEIDKRSRNHLLNKLPIVSQAVFNSYEKRDESSCLKDTRVEVLKEIRNWAQGDDDRSIFWLSGLAGTGKSTIARTVARENDGNGCLGASFFFSRGGGDLAYAGKFFPTVAIQLARRIPSLEGHICESLEKHENVSDLCLNDQWRHLIHTPLSRLERSFSQSRLLIVIDALDECEGENDVSALLKLLSEISDITTVQLRAFITSRPETSPRLGFRQMPSILHHDLVLHDVPRQLVDRDILIFFKQQFSEIRNIFEIVNSDWPGDERLSLLVEKSGGLFIYAATICRFIKHNDQWEPDDLLAIFMPCDTAKKSRKRKRKIPQASPFSELDTIYTHILNCSLKRIENPQDQAEIADEIKEIISTLAALFQPLSLTALSYILGIKQTTIYRRLTHLQSLFSVPEEGYSTVHLLHPSFRDFLFDNKRCTSSYFSVEEQVAHKRISEKCFDILRDSLKQDICGIKQPGILVSDIERTKIQQSLPPEVEYACTYWVQHVLSCGDELRDDHWIHGFLRQHILHWLEALSWIRKLLDGIHALTVLESRLSVKNSPSLFVLVHDAKRFALYCRPAIEQAPLQAYASGLLFAPKKSIVRKQFENQIPGWIKRHSGTKDLWSAVLQTLEGHSDEVEAVAFSSDGTAIASASSDNTVKLWDAQSGQERQTLKGHSKTVSAIAFSPNGTVIASASWDNTVKLWDVQSGQERQTLKGHSNGVSAVAFLSDGTVVVSASWDYTIKLWDTQSGQERQTLKGHLGFLNAVAVSPDSTIIASASDDRTVKLWDAQSGQERQTLEGHSITVDAVVFSPDGTVIASASSDHTIKLWDAQSGQERQTLKGHSHSVSAVAFSPDGTIVASASWDHTVKLWDAQTGQERQTLEGHSGNINAVAFSPDGTVIASASNDHTVKLWGVQLEQERQTLEGPSGWVNVVAFSPDGTTVVSASWDGIVKLWDAQSRQERQTLEWHLAPVSAVAFSPDSTVMALATWHGTVKLWDVRSGRERQTLKGHSSQVTAVAFSPDGTIIASASSDYTVKLWGVQLGQERQILRGHNVWVNAVVFSSDSTVVASASSDCTVKLWDVQSGQERQTLKGHLGHINAVAFSSDDTVMASASDDRTVKLWNIESGQEYQTLKGHLSNVNAVAFSLDSTVVASASADGTVKLWDAQSGQERQRLVAPFVRKLSFSNDGSYLNTNRGVLDITPTYISLAPSITPALFVKEQWIVRGSELLLWLPPDYRATSAAVFGGLVVLGHAFGRVSMIEFAL